MTLTQRRTDHQIKTSITEELDWTPSVRADRIGVALTDGAVTLSGEVDNYPEKDAALRAVLRVRGVTAVADEIVVRHSWGRRNDADIAREASTALDHNVYIPVGSVKAAVHDHVVTLTGAVDWQYQRVAVTHAVSTLAGVVGVTNLVKLEPPVAISAADATEKITAALIRSAQVDATHITVTIAGNDVTLTGSVSSWSEFREAAQAAWSAPGVSQVHNLLNVLS